MIVLIDGQKLFDKIQYPSMVKHLSELGGERSFPNLIETAMEYLQIIIIFNDEILNISCRVGNKAMRSAFSVFSHILSDVFSQCNESSKR